MKTAHRADLLLAVAALVLMLGANALVNREDTAAAATDRLLAERPGMRLYAPAVLPAGESRAFDRETLNQGLLLYVGGDCPLPEDMPVPQARNARKLVGLYVPTAPEVNLSEETIYALCGLVGENPLLKTWVMTGMRAPEEQAAMQQTAFAAYQATMPLAQALARATVDVPDSGFSEHQLATAFDVRLDGPQDWSREDPMARTEDGRWLLENAWRYGFIRRYPPQKAEITGVGNEGTHWRYVGRVHAAVMRAGDWCLEEYLDALAAHGALRLEREGMDTVWVIWVDMGAEGAAFCLPAGAEAQASADNRGGAVCAFTLPADGE